MFSNDGSNVEGRVLVHVGPVVICVARAVDVTVYPEEDGARYGGASASVSFVVIGYSLVILFVLIGGVKGGVLTVRRGVNGVSEESWVVSRGLPQVGQGRSVRHSRGGNAFVYRHR